MIDSLSTLTEKEKQTLRLIVQGYDAKSLASHLGLSVHTVNERLREARRKLSVSSSREAARLLRDAEGTGHDSRADKQLGEVGAVRIVEQASPPEGEARSSASRLRLVGGIAVMSLLLAALALATQAGPATAPETPSAGTVATNQAAVIDAARGFLAQVEARDWAGSYAATTQNFRKANTLAVWSEASEKVYPPLGAVRDRTLASADFVPAHPDGEWIVKFRSSFANRADVIEKVALVRENGVYKVAGVFVD